MERIIFLLWIKTKLLALLTLVETMMAKELAWIIKDVLFYVNQTLGNREKLTVARQCLLLEQVRFFLLLRIRLTTSSFASNFVLKFADKFFTWLYNGVVVGWRVLLGGLWPVFVGVDFALWHFLAESVCWILIPFFRVAMRPWNTMQIRGLWPCRLSFILHRHVHRFPVFEIL